MGKSPKNTGSYSSHNALHRLHKTSRGPTFDYVKLNDPPYENSP